MRSASFLLVPVLLMSLVGCSSTVRTVLVSPPPPLVCQIPCAEYPTAPPTGDALDDWLKWGDDVTVDYQSCMVLHNLCVSTFLQ